MIPYRGNPMGAGPYMRRLRSLYQASDLSQWIDTGYIPSTDGFRIELEMDDLKPESGGDTYFFGYTFYDNGTMTRRGVNLGNSVSRYYSMVNGGFFGFNKLGNRNDLKFVLVFTKTAENAYSCSLKLNNGAASVAFNATNQDIGNEGFSLSLFRMLRYDRVTQHAISNSPAYPYFHLRRFRVFDSGGAGVRDMIPVLDKAGVPCMYDLCTRTFYCNAGTGTFNYE